MSQPPSTLRIAPLTYPDVVCSVVIKPASETPLTMLALMSVLEDAGVPPTVLTDVSRNADCLHNEIFGPVAVIQTFESEENVIERANGTIYGLVAYLYTEDLRRGLAMSERLEFGMIGLNRGLVSDPAAPFGGVKQSGIGREGGKEGMLEFQETQYISTLW